MDFLPPWQHWGRNETYVGTNDGKLGFNFGQFYQVLWSQSKLSGDDENEWGFNADFLSTELTKSIRLTRTEVPNYGILNREAVLGCEFDLENDTLYSVKWYKDGHEFFRYRRDMERPMIIFPLSGVTVNVRGNDYFLLEFIGFWVVRFSGSFKD